jgi:heme-degrading monooxygenase HmoA
MDRNNSSIEILLAFFKRISLKYQGVSYWRSADDFRNFIRGDDSIFRTARQAEKCAYGKKTFAICA